MRLGARAHDFGRHSADKLASLIGEAGFETVQLAPAKAITGIERIADIKETHLEPIRSGFDKNNVKIDILGCYIEPSLPDRDKRLEQVELFLNGITHAKLLGAPLIATETTNFNMPEAERGRIYEGLLDSVLRFVEKAEREQVDIGIEPVFLHTLNSAALTRQLLDTVKSDRLKVVFDPVNLLTVDNIAEQDAIYDEFFSLLGDDIAAVHVKDITPLLEWRNIGDGIVNYDIIARHLHSLKRDLPLLREHVRPESAAKDIEAMKKLSMA